jgi:tape measure domain-containing protein
VSVDILNLGYKVDTAPIKRAEQDLNKFGRANTRAAGEVNELGKRSDSTSKQLAGFKTQIAGLIATYASFASARAIISIADQYTKFTAQLKLATDSEEKFTQAYSNVVAIARSSQSEIGGLGTLYARITNATREMGLAQSDVAKISETVALSLRVSGASASESASAMLQLSQAFGSGVLRGEEFNAVNEAAPKLLRALAESIGAPVGALREMASNGELTADVLARAFKDDELLAKLREQAKEVQTVSSAITSLGNELTVAIGELDKATGASKKFADAILDVAKSISNLQNVYPQIEPYLQGGAVAAGLYLLPGLITNVSIAISSRLIPSLILLAPYVAVFSALTLAAGSAIKVLNAQSAALQNAESTAKRVANLQEQIAKAQALIESGQGSSVTVERLKTMKAQLVEAQDALEKFKVAAQAAQSQDEEQVKTQNTVIQSIKDKVKEQRKAEKQLKELQKAREKALDQQLNVLNAEANVTDQIKEQTIQIIEQTRAVGMSESQLRQLELAKIDDQIATTEQRISMISFSDANDDLIKQYKEQIASLNNLKSAKTGLYNKQAAQKIVDANKEVAKQIEDDLVDAFENAFLRGGDFASSLKRAIEAQFAKLVLRPVIQSVVGSAGSALSSVGGLSGLLSGAGNISSLFGAVSGGLVSGIGNSIASAGSLFGSSALGSFAAGVKGSTLAAGLAGPTTAGASGALGLGATFGAALPWLGGGLALAGLLGSTRLFGRGKVSASILDQNFLGEQQASLQNRFLGTVGALGGTAANASFFFGGNTGRQGQNPNFHLGLDLNGRRRFTTLESRAGATGENGTFLDSEIALNQENISLFTTRAVVTALQESNFARNINELFDSIDERTASMEELTQLFSDAESLKNFNDAMREMNGPLRSLSNSSLDATLSFLRAVNGLEGFQQRMSFFYKEFTSDAEQFSDMSSMLSSELRAVGGALFSTREQFSDFFKTLGPDQFARISALLPQIDSYYDTIEQRQAESFKATLDSLERIRKAGLGIADYLRQLGIAEETLSPQKRLQAASAEFNRLLSLSKLGDVASLEKITGASDQLLNAARSFFGSNAEFKTIFDRVTTELSSLTQGQTGNVFTAQPIAFQRQDQTNQQLITEVQGLRSDIASGESINIKVVTVDGKVIMEETLSAARERSRRGELVVYAAGVK